MMGMPRRIAAQRGCASVAHQLLCCWLAMQIITRCAQVLPTYAHFAL
jgi:hypothetical protein